MNKFIVPLAYKAICTAFMLAEANYANRQLALSPMPITQSDLHTIYVCRPLITGFGGVLETTNFLFSFGPSGKLRYIHRLGVLPGLSVKERNIALSQMTSLIDTNDAYTLATQWLASVDVDVSSLEKSSRHCTSQRFFYPDATGVNSPPELLQNKKMLPVFDVEWKVADKTVVLVTVFGVSKELWELRQENDSFSHRPVPAVVNCISNLLAISDEEFLKYSDMERSNLVVRFAAVHYPPLSMPNNSATGKGVSPGLDSRP